MTGDDHAQRRHGRPVRLGQARSARPAATSPTGSASAATSYIYPGTPHQRRGRRARTRPRASRSRVHVNTDCADWTPAILDELLHDQLAQLRAATSPACPRRPPTAPTASRGATGRRSPRSSSTNGIRLDTNYYYWPRGLGPGPARLLHRLRHADALRRSRRIADRRLPGGDADDRRERHHLLHAHQHAAGQRHRRARLLRRRHDQHAHGQRQPPGSADGRQRRAGEGRPGRLRAPDADLARRPQRLVVRGPDLERRQRSTFSIARGAGANGLQAMLPTQGAQRRASVADHAGGNAVTFTTQTIKGIEYAVFSAAAGDYTATYDVDTPSPPVITGRPARRLTLHRPPR